MSLSLAGYILENSEPKKNRPPAEREGEAPPELQAEAGGGEKGSHVRSASPARGAADEPRASEKEAPALPPPLSPEDFQASCAAEITSLIDEAAKEWSALKEAIEDLRAALKPATFSRALAAASLGAVTPGQRSEPGGRQGPKEASSARGSRPERKPEQRRTALPESAAPPAAEPPADLIVNAKLEEVLKLLREHVALKAAGNPPTPLEIPQKFAHTIAREVAGRLKESVLSNLGAPKPSPAEAPAPSAPSAPQPAAEPRRIPLGDIAGIIDQLINKH